MSSVCNWREVIIVFLLHMCCANDAVGQGVSPYEKVAPSVVRLRVIGESYDGTKIDQYATGFFATKSGYIVSAYSRLFKRTLGGEKIVWKTDGSGKPARKFVLERLGQYGKLEPPDAAVNVISMNEAYDIVVLKLQGNNFQSVSCSGTIERHMLKVTQPLMALSWRESQVTYDIGQGVLAQGDISLGDRYFLGNFTFDMANSRSYFGSPVFNGSGSVVGVLTAGQEGEMPRGSNEAIVTGIQWVTKLLPDSADPSECNSTAFREMDASKEATLEQCVKESLSALNLRTPFTQHGVVRNPGDATAPEIATTTVAFEAPDNTMIVEQGLKVIEEQVIGVGGFETPELLRVDNRIKRVSVKLWVRKNRQLYSPPSVYHAKLEGALQAAISEASVRDECRVRIR